MLEVGAIVAGKYRIESILGRGGMGVVAVATHVQLDQKFALKVVHDSMVQDPDIVERFMREARASAKLKSEHVCRVSDVDQLESGAPFIVMELLEGQDLQKVIAHGVLPVETAADYVLQACIALAEAHALGLVHRDLKPANLFRTTRMDGSALIKVLDFGIAKLTADAELQITQTQTIMGSPGYMSPEQLRSARTVDARSDLWSLGVILYELTTRRLPFVGQTITELAVKVAIDPPEPLPPETDPRFAVIVGRCLEKDLERRYQSVAMLANDLAPIAGADGLHAATLIARLSGAQPGVSAPRSAVVPVQATHLIGHAGTAVAGGSGGTTERVAPKTSRRPLLIVGAALVVIAGGVAAFALTRTKRERVARVHRDAGAAVAMTLVDAPRLDAPELAVDAPADYEHDLLTGLRERKQWSAIIAMEKDLNPNDAELKAAIAEARTALAAEKAARDAAAIKKAGAGSSGSAGSAPPPPTKPPEPPEPIPTGEVRRAVKMAEDELGQRHYALALGLAQKILADLQPHPAAARVATLAACALGHGADARRSFDKIPKLPRTQSMRDSIVATCRNKKIAIE